MNIYKVTFHIKKAGNLNTMVRTIQVKAGNFCDAESRGIRQLKSGAHIPRGWGYQIKDILFVRRAIARRAYRARRGGGFMFSGDFNPAMEYEMV